MSVARRCQILQHNLLSICVAVLFLCPAMSFSQNLCNSPADTEKGDFTLLTPATGCSPFKVRIQDNSGGTDIEYYYFYKGETAAQLSSLSSTTNLENDYFAAGRPAVFTILQKGKKNGKDMYACKNITVRPNNQPLFSYTVCGSIIEINIPKDTLVNDFDYYEVSWGTGNPEIVNNTELPFSGNRTIAPSRRVKVEGFFNAGGLNCTSPAFINIPVYTPTNFPTGYTKANHPNIESVELLSKDQAKLTVKGSFAESGYELYMTPSGQDYPSTPFKTGLKVGDTIIDLPDTTKQYCFKLIRRVPNCGIEVSAEICTVILEEVTPLEKEYEVKWQTYPDQMTGIDNAPAFGRYIEHEERVIITSGDAPEISVEADLFNGEYVSSVDCKEKVCYRIETTTNGQLFYHAFKSKSISNEICIDRKDFNPPALTDAYSSVNAPNSVEIAYTDDSGWSLTKEQFRLLRFNGNDFLPIDSSASAATFTDLAVSTADSSYCYKINYTDECGSTSLNSPDFCTIHLSSADQKEINWTSESPYADEVPLTYEVIHFHETTGAPVDEKEYPFPTATHIINLDLFEEFARYQIKSIAANGTESLSNIIEIPIQATLFLPDAFTPNGDGLNDELKIAGNTKRFVDYQFTIYNRWGEMVFSSDDSAATWNGEVGNEPASTGYYTFAIQAKTNTGETIQKKGVVLLMR